MPNGQAKGDVTTMTARNVFFLLTKPLWSCREITIKVSIGSRDLFDLALWLLDMANESGWY